MLSIVLPRLVSAVVSELVWPILTLPKLRLVGLNSTTVPVPFRLTVCGLPGALSATLSVPLRLPLVFGVKVTSIVQLAPGARLLPQVCVCPKLPAVLTPVICRVWVPQLVRVTGCARARWGRTSYGFDWRLVRQPLRRDGTGREFSGLHMGGRVQPSQPSRLRNGVQGGCMGP
jgi:hypothetical protein